MGSGEGRWDELREELPLRRRTFLLASGGVAAAAAGCADEDEGGEFDPVDADELDEYSEDDAEDGDDGTETPEESDDGGTETPEEETETPEEETETPEEDDSSEEEDDDDDEDEDENDDDDGAQGIDPDHPAAAGIDQSPVIGPGPTSAPAAIIAFDDPSCPNCADFHQGAFQDLQSDADAGSLSFVWRGVPSTEDWAESALLALWATYERDQSTFWSLLSHLLAEQGSISEGNVLDEVESFLEGTGVDGGAVRSDAESGTYSGRVGTDVDAAVGAGIPGTPVFHLFRDGEHRTEIVGNQSYDVFSNALEL